MKQKLLRLLPVAMIVAGLGMVAAPSVSAGDVCAGLDSGKIDTTGDPATVTMTAPAGNVITEYCIKAGSAQSGGGPVYIDVDPPKASITVGHPSGKDVSHYSFSWEPKPPPSTTTTTTTTSTTTTTTTQPEVPVKIINVGCSQFETARFLIVEWTQGSESGKEVTPLAANEGPGDEIDVALKTNPPQTVTVVVPDNPLCSVPVQTTTTTTEPEVTTTTTEPEVTTTTTEPEVTTTTTEPEVTTTTVPRSDKPRPRSLTRRRRPSLTKPPPPCRTRRRPCRLHRHRLPDDP